MNSFIGSLFLLLSCITYSFGQVPFECDGRSYRVLSANDGTYLQEILQNRNDQTIAFNDLHFYPNFDINAIAYHPTQNVIYGVLQTPPYRLCRIDAEFELEILQTLPLSTELIFVSGDISPDEKHLVLFGFGDTNFENILALVDIESGEYESEIITLQTTNPNQPYIYCADIAFHPTTGKLFGFDFKNSRLVKLDISNRIIENDDYPISGTAIGNVPSIFFNAQGELFGIGTNLQEEDENRGYYQFDLETGQPLLHQELDIEKNQDACSCPYKIKLLYEVRERKNAPCTELVFEIELINKTKTALYDLVLSDTFPQNVIIKNINQLPVEGSVESGIDNNILTINNLDLPIGSYSFEVTLEIDEDVILGQYENQIILSGLSLEELGLNSVLSDDPQTAVPNDKTKFSIEALSDPFEEEFIGICKDSVAILDARNYGANSYKWSTGETTQVIRVESEGDYQVTVTTDCDQSIGTAVVKLDEITLELGRDITVEKGETINLEPNYTSLSHIKTFNWQTDGSQEIDCSVCKNLIFQPLRDTEVLLQIENRTGCHTEDKLLLNVKDVLTYIANIFSPNFDNQNDTFFLQGNVPYDIAMFEVYNRWGNLVYQKKNIIANQSEYGWDGTHDGVACQSGVYVWQALINYKNGSQEIKSGSVTLIR